MGHALKWLCDIAALIASMKEDGFDAAVEHGRSLGLAPDAEQAEPLLSPKEMEVLLRLESRTDKDIAQELNLTYHGVRYRVRHIFAKLGARSRLDAVHRARAMGLLPGEGVKEQTHR